MVACDPPGTAPAAPPVKAPDAPQSPVRRELRDWLDMLRTGGAMAERKIAMERLARLDRAALLKGRATLAEALSDKDPVVRMTAAGLAMKLGADGHTLAPGLTALLDDKDAYITVSAARSLLIIGAARGPAVEALFRVAASSTDSRLRDLTARTLYGLDGHDPAVVAVVKARLADTDPQLCGLALRVAGGFGEHAAPLRPAIQDLAAHPNAFVARLAEESLRRLRGEPIESTPPRGPSPAGPPAPIKGSGSDD